MSRHQNTKKKHTANNTNNDIKCTQNHQNVRLFGHKNGDFQKNAGNHLKL